MSKELIDQYFDLEGKVHEYFGYKEDWRAIPMDDARDYFWCLDGEGPGRIAYAETEEKLREGLETESGDYYQDDIYTQRFLPKWVYRGPDYTMIACDPHVDGNKFLRIFSNANEVTGFKVKSIFD
jgi:hypothetical protein